MTYFKVHVYNVANQYLEITFKTQILYNFHSESVLSLDDIIFGLCHFMKIN